MYTGQKSMGQKSMCRITVEHAYMDNPHDNAILKDEAQLKAMGTADADAIASYYNLQIKTKTEN